MVIDSLAVIRIVPAGPEPLLLLSIVEAFKVTRALSMVTSPPCPGPVVLLKIWAPLVRVSEAAVI